MAAGLLAPPAVPAAAATAAVPPPSGENSNPAASTTADGLIDVFYEGTATDLVHLQAGPGGWRPAESLGGRLLSSPASISIGTPTSATWAFVTGADNAVWYRRLATPGRPWEPWRTAGGASFNGVSASCVQSPEPTVYVQGGDGKLWRRTLGSGRWVSLGGQLGSAPAAVPAVAGTCAGVEEVLALGTNDVVYEYVGGRWSRVGGLALNTPAAVRLANGDVHVFVIGWDTALWTTYRLRRSSLLEPWRRISGRLTSAPAAQVWPGSPETIVLFGWGPDRRLWRGSNVVGSATWTWTPVP